MKYMKYVGDLITVARIVIGFAILAAILNSSWMVAAVLFASGVISDALDGTAAKRWPYSPEERMKYIWRQRSHDFDNVADTVMTFMTLAGLTIQFPIVRIVVILMAVGGLGFYSFVNITKKKNPELAEKVDVVFGWFYGALLIALYITLVVLATINNIPQMILMSIISAIILVILLVCKKDRLNSRPEDRD